MTPKDMAIVYMVAGMSSRFGGKIKQFARVGPNGETLIEYSMNQAIKAGFNKIIFVVGSMTEKPFKEMFGDSYKGIPVKYALQDYNPKERDKPWGTVDALCSAKGIFDCPFIVCNGDDIYGENTFKMLANHLKNHDYCATAYYFLKNVIPEKGTTNRGIFCIRDGYVEGLEEVFNIEKSDLAQKGLNEDSPCSMNIFGLNSDVVQKLDYVLEQFKIKNKGDRKIECLLPTELSKLIGSGVIKMKIYPSEDRWFGVTNPEDEEIVRKQIQELENSKSQI